MREHLTEVQNELASEMNRISEQAYCAGWTSGLEFYLWKFLLEGPGEFGCLEITQGHIDKLRALSDACGGWIVWDRANDREFVPADDWTSQYAAWSHRRTDANTR